jgi:hypothetical protein
MRLENEIHNDFKTVDLKLPCLVQDELKAAEELGIDDLSQARIIKVDIPGVNVYPNTDLPASYFIRDIETSVKLRSYSYNKIEEFLHYCLRIYGCSLQEYLSFVQKLYNQQYRFWDKGYYTKNQADFYKDISKYVKDDMYKANLTPEESYEYCERILLDRHYMIGNSLKDHFIDGEFFILKQ